MNNSDSQSGAQQKILAQTPLEAVEAVRIEGLQFSWPGQPPLLDISLLSIPLAATFFVGGRSGGGKSTLLSLLAGVLVPTRGSCCVLGNDLHTMTSAARDRLRGQKMGVVFQQFNLLPYLSVIDNTCLPTRIFQNRAEEACLAHGSPLAQAEQLLAQLGLDRSLWGQPAHKLSVGQQQRVALARAFMGAPRLVIADEPTSALDEDSRLVFLELFLSLAQRHHTTLVMVSHDARMGQYFDQRVWLSTSGSIEPYESHVMVES